MLEAILKKLLFGWAMSRAEKKDKKFIENYTQEQNEEGVIFKGRERDYLENLAAAARMVGNMYDIVICLLFRICYWSEVLSKAI